MGLLDQVLGQVLGGLGGGQEPAPQSGGGFPQGGGFQQGGSPQGGGSAPGGAQQGGFAGNGLPGGIGNMLSGKGGPIALAILALLASKHMKSGAGGYGSILHDMFSGQRGDGGLTQGSLPGGGGVLGPNQGSSSGGFLNDVGGMLGGGQAGTGGGQGPSGGAGPGGIGGLGGMLTGSVLGSGLGELLERFTQNGHGDVASSWVGTGPNRAMSPSALETSLGSDTINDLSRETGMDRGDLLSQLSQTLPEVVDRLTPNGRLPTHDESAGWV